MQTEQLDDSAQQALDLGLDVSRARDDEQELEHTQQMPKKLSMFDSQNVSTVTFVVYYDYLTIITARSLSVSYSNVRTRRV